MLRANQVGQSNSSQMFSFVKQGGTAKPLRPCMGWWAFFVVRENHVKRRYWVFGMIALFLAACTSNQEAETIQVQGAYDSPVNLENYGQAPELENAIWLNTDVPLRLTDLRGKVVLLEMWTFG